MGVAPPVVTVRLAVAVLPRPLSFEVTFPVTLVWLPPAIPFTPTVKVQLALGARVAPVRLMTPVPAVAVIAPPPQLPLRPLGVATTSPFGKTSLTPTPVTAKRNPRYSSPEA